MLTAERVKLDLNDWMRGQHSCILCGNSCLENVVRLTSPLLRAPRYIHLQCLEKIRAVELEPKP